MDDTIFISIFNRMMIIHEYHRVQKSLKPSSSHNFPFFNLPPIFEILVVDMAWLGRGSRFKLRENTLTSYSYGFELMVIVAENKLALE